jgi:hypothetical protein
MRHGCAGAARRAPKRRRGVIRGWRAAKLTPMLSRAQEARVREILGSHPPGNVLAYCLEHLAATAQIPLAHLGDLAAFVRKLRLHGACQTGYGGTCNASGHATPRLLIWGPSSPRMAVGSQPGSSGSLIP